MTIYLNDGLVMCLTFNRGTGTFAQDESGSGNNGTLHNMGDSNWVTGTSGTALEFNGTDEYVSCADNETLRLNGAFSIAFWYKLGSFLHTWPGILTKGNGTYATGYGIWYDSDGTLSFKRNNGWEENTNNRAVTTSWRHFVYVYTPGTWTWYVDGVASTTGSVTYPTNTGTDNVLLGRNDEYGNGSLDELRYYERAITAAEVAWLYNHPSGAMAGVPSPKTNIKTLDDGLVLYLPLNEGSGVTARDDSGSGLTGELQHMSSMDWVTGKSGGALEFNGIDEYVDCSGNDALKLSNALTLSAWVKLDATSGWQTIIGHADGMYTLQSNGDKLIFYYCNSGATMCNSVTSTTTLTTEWTHVVCMRQTDDTTLLYINGVQEAVTESWTQHQVDTNRWYIGNSAWDEYISGKIDEVRIYNRALTQTEITWLYNHPSGALDDYPSGRACFTDLNGDHHTISDMISLDVTSELSDSADSFSLELSNIADRYSWLERGCEIEIGIGMDGVNTQKLTGVVLDVERYIDGDDYPFISVSGEDWGYKLNHLFFSGRFYDLELSDLLEAILDSADYSSSKTWQEIAGLSSDYSHIDSTAFSINVASYKWKSLSAAAKEIADTAGFEWYVDVDKKVHLFDAGATAISATITESDLVAPPSLYDNGDIVNRAIVVGGYDQREDQEVAGQTATVTVTSDVSANASVNAKFMPTQDYLSSVMIWTKLIGNSSSGITLSVQEDSGGSPDGVNLPHGKVDVSLDEINDGDYTEFRFGGHVTLTPGKYYHLVIYGTTKGSGEGQDIGTDGSSVVYITRWPSQVAILAEDLASQSMHGMTMCTPHTDNKLEDPDLVEQMANNMLVLSSKTVASLELHGTAIDSGDVVKLTLDTPGIAVDKTMKVLSSSWNIGERFINNSLELKEI